MRIIKIWNFFAVCLGSDARKETAPNPSMLLYQSMTKLPWTGSNSLDHDRPDDSMTQLQIRLSIQEPIPQIAPSPKQQPMYLMCRMRQVVSIPEDRQDFLRVE